MLCPLKVREGVIAPSVRIYNFINNDFVKDRVCLSQGTLLAESSPDITYEPLARVPRKPWRLPNIDEKKVLFTKTIPDCFVKTVGVLRFPQRILKNIPLSEIDGKEEFLDYFYKSSEGAAVLEQIIEFLTPSFEESSSHRTICAFNRAGLESTAFPFSTKRYIGLHIDYHAGESIFQRNNSSNRISINIGKEDRYICFVNLAVDDLIKIVQPSSSYSNDCLSLHFFQNFSNYPVIKVKIQPGEAYIAPTQNIIHDGIGSISQNDLHITVTGRIKLPEISSILKAESKNSTNQSLLKHPALA